MASVDAGTELEVELDVLGVATVLVETVLDVATVLVVTVLVVAVLDVVTVLVVVVIAGTVIGTATTTGAALQLAIVSDPQSLLSKLLIRPNSL